LEFFNVSSAIIIPHQDFFASVFFVLQNFPKAFFTGQYIAAENKKAQKNPECSDLHSGQFTHLSSENPYL